ncbi:MAG: hypothetical protein ACI35W_02720 [Anaeroplasmataceae bacterium]
MSQDINEYKQKMLEEKAKNQHIVRILKTIVYVLAVLLFLDIVPYFIVGIMMEKSNYFFNHLAMPLAIILFGAIAILLTQINPRISVSANTKGDKLVFFMGIAITILGIGYLFYEIFS